MQSNTIKTNWGQQTHTQSKHTRKLSSCALRRRYTSKLRRPCRLGSRASRPTRCRPDTRTCARASVGFARFRRCCNVDAHLVDPNFLAHFAANVAQSFRAVKALHLDTAVAEHARHLAVLCVAPSAKFRAERPSSCSALRASTNQRATRQHSQTATRIHRYDTRASHIADTDTCEKSSMIASHSQTHTHTHTHTRARRAARKPRVQAFPRSSETQKQDEPWPSSLNVSSRFSSDTPFPRRRFLPPAFRVVSAIRAQQPHNTRYKKNSCHANLCL